MAVLSLSTVSKYFGPKVGVEGIDIEVGRGESVLLFGHNGSGKTTLLRLLATLTRPSEGTISLEGTEFSRDRPTQRGEIGFVAHETYHYEQLTARENLRLHARLHGVDRSRCETQLDAVGLADRASDPVSEFSHGMAKRLALARATLHDPLLLLLDEPFTGLDQESLLRVTDQLRNLEETTIVFATHDVDHGFTHADRVLTLKGGQLVRDIDTADCPGPDAIRQQYVDTPRQP
ncbi:heme ABC exporter, ATP-binding protein CcmA [Haloarcula taiwanensis]|uniref:Heme ABC exporter, ATP-binding protein CcmA n=1 Tax=Haloarcula taiwanensis TaxID=1932004 RepID=A0A2H4ZZ19_9EURY|nr:MULTISPECIES: heme ABC exporter ATP-binding protein CcmA [Haloarcula]AUG47731.1 heme ABC exporter, ATP-binding protein CcmA [Haloarcula taiwanensis]RLM39037.1 heme ABC exporter ATP-binding protein CcmA [Haloarcula sp. Atlit-120R]RLM46982.1 heme ABC exporter ATP-binding protein CcmA [Haloarcula sp. Atlit-47R]